MTNHIKYNTGIYGEDVRPSKIRRKLIQKLHIIVLHTEMVLKNRNKGTRRSFIAWTNRKSH